jgi:hypothetical protein
MDTCAISPCCFVQYLFASQLAWRSHNRGFLYEPIAKIQRNNGITVTFAAKTAKWGVTFNRIFMFSKKRVVTEKGVESLTGTEKIPWGNCCL